MAKAKKFTFKFEPKETGLASVGSHGRSAYVRLNGNRVGTISAQSWQRRYHELRFMVYNSGSPGSWSWLHVKSMPEFGYGKMQDVKDWINENFEKFSNLNLRQTDDDYNEIKP